MKITRQQVLLAGLIGLGVLRVGEYVVTSMIQGPLQELRARNREMEEKIGRGKKLLQAARTAGQQIEKWQRQSLPANTEQARSLYRNWLLESVRNAKLRNAVVDSGSPGGRRGLYRSMPFNVRARGTLQQVTSALFAIERSALLHRISSLRLIPNGTTGQFDFSASIEALILPKAKPTRISSKTSNRLASTDRKSYDVIATDNLFGVGVDHTDPMVTTILSGVTYRNGIPIAWITETSDNRVHKVAVGSEFSTLALNGRVVHVDDTTVTIESSGLQLTLKPGQSFADGTQTPTSGS